MRARDEEKSTALRITNQFHSKGGMAYDLKCDGVRLTLHVSPKGSLEDPGEWRIEARGARTADNVAVVTEWGATKVAALEAVGLAWADSLATNGMRVFDWNAVAKILSTVGAV